MPKSIEFPLPDGVALPIIPVTLSLAGVSTSASALLDTGATVNVLPYDVGLQLGAIWEEQTLRLPLAGNLAKVEARALFINVQIGNLEPARLAFAWAQSSQVPLILGQTNFFQEFDVCFQRSRRTIEITDPKVN
jgi:Aspartyl protease